MLMYSKLKTHLDSQVDLLSSLELYIESIVETSYHSFTRFKKRFPNKFKFLIEDIDRNNFTLGRFKYVTDEQIEIMFIKARDSLVLEPREDEIFSLSLFNNVNDAIISKNKVNNLKRLHDTVLLPIILYYKSKMEVTGSILIVDQGISNETKLQQQGKAVAFRLIGVDRAIIIEDLTDRNIDIEFGLVRNHGKAGVFISIPYDAEGRTVRRLIDGNKGNW